MNQLPNALPQLAAGAHPQASGKACIMNALSYLNGDTYITDHPSCTYMPLAKTAQILNDTICPESHSGDESFGLLCSFCSNKMWMIGIRLFGTAKAGNEMNNSDPSPVSRLDVQLSMFAHDRISKTIGFLGADNYDRANILRQALAGGVAYLLHYGFAMIDRSALVDGQIGVSLLGPSHKLQAAKKAELMHAVIDRFYSLTGLDKEEARELSAEDVEVVRAGACLV